MLKNIIIVAFAKTFVEFRLSEFSPPLAYSTYEYHTKRFYGKNHEKPRIRLVLFMLS